MGIGFAIPVNMARDVMNSLIRDGKVTRGRLGVHIQDLDENLAKSFDYGSRDGVLVGDVEADSPAEAAGMRSGDILIEFDGRAVKRTDDLRLRVAGTSPGEKVDVKVYRDGKPRKLQVQIGELENGVVASSRTETQLEEGVGMNVRTLTPEIAEQLSLESSVKGAVVTDVEAFGPAADAGLRQGDVIVQVQGTPIGSAEELRRELGRHSLADGVRLVVVSGGSRRFAVLTAD
jgi:serine protease Do